jgi:SAM-dependent methyltransferase
VDLGNQGSQLATHRAAIFPALTNRVSIRRLQHPPIAPGGLVPVASSSPGSELPAESEASSTSFRACLELFLVSFFILFFELACIRWFGSTVIFLTFFTNVVLMACFLGVSVGCLAAGRRWSFMNGFIPLTLLAVVAACGVLWAYQMFSQVMIDVGSQQSPQLIYFGTDARRKDPSRFVVPIEVLAGFFFVLIVLLFVGPGQELGRRFNAVRNRIAGYTADILGSLTGIAAFAMMSYFWVPAIAWFAVAIVASLVFTRRRRWWHLVLGILVLGGVELADWPRDNQGVKTEVTWSPYYQVRFKPLYGSIDVNNLGHQGMLPIERAGPAYMLPHLLNRDAGGRPFEDVMIIGAGSGNDVAAALRQGAKHVAAVEIDPVINLLGRLHHPDHPFASPSVSIHLDDGRSFVRKTEREHDLISYAVVDSLALHSSYSSIRLESFLFTEEAFQDIKARLKPGGVFAMYNFYRQGWVVARLVRLAEKVFGSKPLVISLPYQAVIGPTNDQRDYITFLLVGNEKSKVVDAIRAQFQKHQFFWLCDQPGLNEPINGFGPAPPVSLAAIKAHFNKIGPAAVELTGTERIPNDDWPFLYLRDPAIPVLNLRGIALVASLSLLLLFAFFPMRRVRPNGQMFFLGAGFMLLETKGVVQMALLFGSTWVVNSIVFFSILTMILLSNFYVLAVKPRRLWPYFALLFLALAISSLVPMSSFLGLPGAGKVIASCSLVYIPVFFAGVIFATEFRDSTRPDVDFGSNIGGIILGGLSENLSLVLGFNHLLWVAIVFYVLAAILRPGSYAARPAG